MPVEGGPGALKRGLGELRSAAQVPNARLKRELGWIENASLDGAMKLPRAFSVFAASCWSWPARW